MTVSNTTSRNQYTATSGQTVFPYTFEVFDKDDLVVLKNGTLLSEGTNYTVSGVGNDNGGNITLTVGATAGDILTIYRDMAYQRLTDYQNSGDFLAQEVNDDFDRLWLAVQQNNEGNDRAIVKPITDSASIDMTLPSSVDRANSFLTFDATGAPSVTRAGDPAAPSSIVRQQFTGDGATLVYTLASAPGALGQSMQVFIDGVYQENDTYTVSGTSLTFSEAPPLNASIETVAFEVNAIGETSSNLVSYTPAGSGAVQTTVQSKLRETVSVKDFGAVGDGVTDDTAAIQAALDYARSLVLQTAVGVQDPNFPNKGGATLYIPAGKYLITQIEVPETVSLVGAGKTSTLFTSSYDGAIIRNKVTAGDGTYDKAGIYMSDFAIQGDRTKTNQTGIDTLRLFDCRLENITIYKCGKHGLHIRQSITSSFESITCSNNVGAGIVLDEGVNSWADLTLSGLPSNANTLFNCHSFRNDGAGLLITGRANGNIINGGSYEANYLASGDNVGYNIEVLSTTFSRNLFTNIWTEGAVESHIYVEHATSGSSTEINDWKHFGNGSSGHVDRALICNKGTVTVSNAFGHGDSYVSNSGSIAPFRVDVSGGDSVINVVNCSGSTITTGIFLEDAAGNTVSTMAQTSLSRPISGLLFDNTLQSSNVNSLDYYKEGTWTPVLTTDGTDFTSITYDNNTGGRYTRIGDMVFIQGYVRTDAVTVGSASGNVLISGLPFNGVSHTGPADDGYASVTIGTSSNFVINHPCVGQVWPGVDYFYLKYRATANGALVNLPYTDISTGANSNYITFSAAYKTGD